MIKALKEQNNVPEFISTPFSKPQLAVPKKYNPMDIYEAAERKGLNVATLESSSEEEEEPEIGSILPSKGCFSRFSLPWIPAVNDLVIDQVSATINDFLFTEYVVLFIVSATHVSSNENEPTYHSGKLMSVDRKTGWLKNVHYVSPSAHFLSLSLWPCSHPDVPSVLAVGSLDSILVFSYFEQTDKSTFLHSISLDNVQSVSSLDFSHSGFLYADLLMKEGHILNRFCRDSLSLPDTIVDFSNTFGLPLKVSTLILQYRGWTGKYIHRETLDDIMFIVSDPRPWVLWHDTLFMGQFETRKSHKLFRSFAKKPLDWHLFRELNMTLSSEVAGLSIIPPKWVGLQDSQDQSLWIVITPNDIVDHNNVSLLKQDEAQNFNFTLVHRNRAKLVNSGDGRYLVFLADGQFVVFQWESHSVVGDCSIT